VEHLAVFSDAAFDIGPTLTLYDGGEEEPAILALSLNGGGAQINVSPQQARDLALALNRWAAVQKDTLIPTAEESK
jgi:hypothetical protein